MFFVKTPPERRLCSFLRDLCASRPRSPPLHIAAFRFARARSVRYKPSLFPAEFPRPHADILFRRAAPFRQKSLAPFFPDPPSPLLNASFLSGQAARRFVSRKKIAPSPLTFPMSVPFCRQVSLSRQGQDPSYARAFRKKVDCRPPCAPSPADDNPLRRKQRSRHALTTSTTLYFIRHYLSPAARHIVFYLYIVIVLYSTYKAVLHHPAKRLSQIKFKKPSPRRRHLTGNHNPREHCPRSARSPALPLSAAKTRANIGQYERRKRK